MADPRPAGVDGVEPRASFGRRFVAFTLDFILFYLVWTILSVTPPEGLMSIVGLVLGLAYFTFFEGIAAGQTVGKRAMKIRVVDFSTGERLGMQRALIRNLGRIVSGLVCLLGFLWMLWDRDKQTWHDKIGITTVVPVASFPVEKWLG